MLVVHPNFLFTEINSLFMLCKNRLFMSNIQNPKKWALFRELYGPSKFCEKFRIYEGFHPKHTRLYAKGTAFRNGHLIIPIMNLETLISEVWANITIGILLSCGKTFVNKIVINEELLQLSFCFKIMLSYNYFQNNAANFEKMII